MKKVLLSVSVVLLSVQSVFAAGYCPTNDEIQLKMTQFQTRAMQNLNGSSLAEIEALNREMNQYQANILPGCLQYFQMTSTPDCKRLSTLGTAYLLLDKTKRFEAKGRILNIAKKYETSCVNEYRTIELFVK